MFVLFMNSSDGNSMWAKFYGEYETHDEAHNDMVEYIERHRADWMEAYDADEECFETKITDNTGCLFDGDMWDWTYYEKYFIFDCDDAYAIFSY